MVSREVQRKLEMSLEDIVSENPEKRHGGKKGRGGGGGEGDGAGGGGRTGGGKGGGKKRRRAVRDSEDGVAEGDGGGDQQRSGMRKIPRPPFSPSVPGGGDRSQVRGVPPPGHPPPQGAPRPGHPVAFFPGGPPPPPGHHHWAGMPPRVCPLPPGVRPGTPLYGHPPGMPPPGPGGVVLLVGHPGYPPRPFGAPPPGAVIAGHPPLHFAGPPLLHHPPGVGRPPAPAVMLRPGPGPMPPGAYGEAPDRPRAPTLVPAHDQRYGAPPPLHGAPPAAPQLALALHPAPQPGSVSPPAPGQHHGYPAAQPVHGHSSPALSPAPAPGRSAATSPAPTAAPAPTQAAPQRTMFQVFLQNVPPELTARDLAEAFGEVSSRRVESVDLMRDEKTGRASGEAVVVFSSLGDAQNAVRRYHGGDLNGRKLVVVYEGEIRVPAASSSGRSTR